MAASDDKPSSAPSPVSPFPTAAPLTGVTPPRSSRRRLSFGEDFRRFFVSGMAAVLPTLITLWLLVKLWDFLWESLGRHIIFAIREIWYYLGTQGLVQYEPAAAIQRAWSSDNAGVRIVGVLLAVLLVYTVGVFVGNFIGRTFYRLIEATVMRIPLVRAVYPAVKQVTDFLLSNRRAQQFASSHVVATQPHANGIWSIGLVTGGGLKPLADATGDDLVTVFIPSTPTAFTGYVVVVPRTAVVELPMTVEDAMRLLISGGVIGPATKADPATADVSGSPSAARGGGPHVPSQPSALPGTGGS